MAASPRLAPLLKPARGWAAPSPKPHLRLDPIRLGPFGLVAIATVFNLWVLRAESSVVMNVNDSAVHTAMIRWARAQIDQGHVPLDGWFPYLGFGFPLFHHYQSLPHIVAAYMSLLSDPATIYSWSVYLLLGLWPISVYLGARWLGVDRWAAGVSALISPLLVSVTWYGFEHSSFTWRGLGMWTALWGMWLLPLAWGLSWRAITGKGSLALAALVVALTIVCHFLTGYLALLTLGVWFVARPSLRRAVRAAAVGVGAVLIAAWAIIPLVGDSAWAINSQYIQGTYWLDSYGAPKVFGWLVHGQLFDNGRFPIISILVALGLVVCLAHLLSDERARALVGIFALSLLLFFGRPTLGPLLNLLPGSRDLLFHRYIMGVHLAGIVLAGVGVVWVSRRLGSLGSQRIPHFGRPLAIAALAVVALIGLRPAWEQVAAYDQADAEFIPSQQSVEQGDGADIAALLDRVRTLGGGRVYAGSAATWGRTYGVGMVPMYAVLLNHDVDATGFTLRVPSLLADTEASFDETNPAQYDLFNIRYVLLPADRVPAVPATPIELKGRHRLWQVPTTGYFDLVDTIGPPLVASRYDIAQKMAPFMSSRALYEKQFPTLRYEGYPASLPTHLPGVTLVGPAGTVAYESDSPADGVFRAEVVANRLAVVLLKTTFDPRWRVTVDGTEVQPEIVAPGMVARTVSPGRHTIEFRYVPVSSYPLLFVLGLVALLGLWIAPRALIAVPPLLGRATQRVAASPRVAIRRFSGLPLPAMASPRIPRRMSRLVPGVVAIFITAWAIRSLIVTGGAVLNGHYASMLGTSPSTTQSVTGDLFARKLVALDRSLSSRASVAVLWQMPAYFGGMQYPFFWSTFWLYPRKVTVTDSAAVAVAASADAFIQVHAADEPGLAPPGFTMVSNETGSQYIVTFYERTR